MPIIDRMTEMGFTIYATSGTTRSLRASAIAAETLRWPLEEGIPNCLEYISSGKIGLVINIPKNNQSDELSNDYLIRRAAVDCGVPLFTNLNLARRYLEALEAYDPDDLPVRSW